MHSLYKYITNRLLFFSLVFSVVGLTHCKEDEDGPCNNPDPLWDCDSYSYAIINSETNENLIGNSKGKYEPDLIRIYAQNGSSGVKFETDSINRVDWWYIGFGFSYPFGECSFVNKDTTFMMRYFIELTREDTDTLDIYITPCYENNRMSYNGNFNVERPTTNIPPYEASWYLRKDVN